MKTIKDRNSKRKCFCGGEEIFSPICKECNDEKKEIILKEIIKDCDRLVKKGLLKKKVIKGEVYYQDSKEVKALLKEGYSREGIKYKLVKQIKENKE